MTNIPPTDPTPGPWHAVLPTDSRRHASVPVYSHGNGFSIATVWAKRGSYRPTAQTWREAHANASLIAAAPDLREALAEIIRQTPGIRKDLLEKACVALDKAIGGPALRAKVSQ